MTQKRGYVLDSAQRCQPGSKSALYYVQRLLNRGSKENKYAFGPVEDGHVYTYAKRAISTANGATVHIKSIRFSKPAAKQSYRRNWDEP